MDRRSSSFEGKPRLADETPETQLGSGHRARLRARLLNGGDGALADYEVLEYLLMTAIPRKDVKPLAKSLLTRFGSLAGVLNADPRALVNHPPVNPAVGGQRANNATHVELVALHDPCVDIVDRALAEEAHLGTTRDLPVGDVAAGDGADAAAGYVPPAD